MYKAYFKMISSDVKKIQAIWKALHPDNITTPSYMNIFEEVDEEQYIIKILINEESPKRFDSLRGTLDDIACLVELIQNTINILEEKQNS
ncbi:MAG: hypothetical protein GXO43_00255 [Crenarchaeota archaeon]|nr:hypothetical protein [Thermoproteota archaeon]